MRLVTRVDIPKYKRTIKNFSSKFKMILDSHLLYGERRWCRVVIVGVKIKMLKWIPSPHCTQYFILFLHVLLFWKTRTRIQHCLHVFMSGFSGGWSRSSTFASGLRKKTRATIPACPLASWTSLDLKTLTSTRLSSYVRVCLFLSAPFFVCLRLCSSLKHQPQNKA